MFTAIDPDGTTDYTVRGAVFKLGAIPAGVWQRVKFAQVAAFERAQRRANISLAKDGLDPSDPFEVKGTKVPRRDFVANSDPKFREELVSIMFDLLRFGIRGHSGIVYASGEEVPFKTESVPYENAVYNVVSAETLRVYGANYDITAAVYSELCKRCELGPDEKKA